MINKEQSVILTTHEINEIQDIADTVILLEEGRVFDTFSRIDAQKAGTSIVDKMRELYK